MKNFHSKEFMLSLRTESIGVALLVVLVVPCHATAQSTQGPSSKRAIAVRTASPIRLDGVLDDASWREASWFEDFLQKDPDQFAPPGDRTAISFVYDDDALYVGARMYSTDPENIPRDVTRRDQYGNSEHIVVSLDPYQDRRTAYSFSVTAGGVRRDYYHPQDTDDYMARDFTFDPVWEARVSIDSLGWTAEMRIPFSQLRFNSQENQAWGLNIFRWMPQRNEDAFWVVVPRNETGWSSRFGTLTGIENIPATRRIEVLPYLAATSRFTTDPGEGNPFDDGQTSAGRVGGDIKMGLGSSLTLTATVNPDFGQVEADPAEVNLTAFETFFSERRPFFTESRQVLEGQVSDYFYSRRIGGRAHGSASGDYVSGPDNTTILSAAKVTGRLASGMSVGALGAVTQREFAHSYDSTSGTFGRQEVEPATLYGVLRLQQEVGPSSSVLGFSFSGMRRFLSKGSYLRNLLSREAFAGGADWVLRFQGGRYEIWGHLGMSYVSGDTAAMLRIQRSSAHYFQRPDAVHGRLDPSRESLAGVTAALTATKNAGNVLWTVQAQTVSPRFETNDMGRLQRANTHSLFGKILYRQTEPSRVARRWSVGVQAHGNWNYDWNRTVSEVTATADITFANYIDTRLRLIHGPRNTNDTFSRGGPLMGTGHYYGVGVGTNSNFSNPNGWRLDVEYYGSESGTHLGSLRGGLFFRPSTRFGFSIDPFYQRHVDPRQYITSIAGGNEATFGTRYVFANVDKTTLSAQIRMSYTVSPDLTIEAYAEPFTASGRYYDHKELPEPRSRFFNIYGTEGTTIERENETTYRVTDSSDGSSFTLPVLDFNSFSFRSNLVLRWEWRRGSTLFLVWQQNRSAACSAFADPMDCPIDGTPGALSQPGFLADTFRAPGDNFFAVKLSYWLPVH